MRSRRRGAAGSPDPYDVTTHNFLGFPDPYDVKACLQYSVLENHFAVLLTLTTTHTPATDLGYLLAKHPARLQTFELAFGKAHVFYPEASQARCTAALLLDVDPVALSRGRQATGGSPLEPYVNDRPYVASSFLSVAIAQVFGTALAGRSKERPELVDTAIPLRADLPVADDAERRVQRRLAEPARRPPPPS